MYVMVNIYWAATISFPLIVLFLSTSTFGDFHAFIFIFIGHNLLLINIKY